MIVGHGTDLVAMRALQTMLEDRASRFLVDTFTAREIAYARTAHSELHHLAARYAAKEAAIKAFGSAGNEHVTIPLSDIEVVRSAAGAPSLSFTGVALTLATTLKLQNVWLSLSHDGDYAIASVILETSSGAGLP